MKLITLLTDFGLKDGYAGILKGVILRISPEAQVVDLTHLIPPQAVLEGALTLARCVPYFPTGTIHVAVVDPGVGTVRRPIAAQIGQHYFVGPDNGLFSLVARPASSTGKPVRFFHLNQARYWLPQLSSTFHGRDIFAPVAAHLANGVSLEQLGSEIHDAERIQLPEPVRTGSGWEGQVIHVDTFGNLATNLTTEHLAGFTQVEILIAGIKIAGVAKAFGDRQAGEPVALVDSAGWLSIAEVNGNAARAWNVGVGTQVILQKMGE